MKGGVVVEGASTSRRPKGRSRRAARERARHPSTRDSPASDFNACPDDRQTPSKTHARRNARCVFSNISLNRLMMLTGSRLPARFSPSAKAP